MKRLMFAVWAAVSALGLGAVSAQAAYTPHDMYNFDTNEMTRNWSADEGARWGEPRGSERPAAPHTRATLIEEEEPRAKSHKTRAPRAALRRAGGEPRARHAARAPALRSLSGGIQSGVASYYWQPQRLASGGWFNPNAMTAAHRSLPFGTRVRVTSLGSGRSVDVTINDRGPYVGGRVIDLSSAAAGLLGMKNAGLARVKLDLLGR